MHSLAKAVLGSTIGTLAWACTTPTELCSCGIERSSIVLVGTLRSAQGGVLPNASFVVEARTATLPSAPPATTDVRTDASGNFAAPIYSPTPPGVHSLAARFLSASGADTVRVPLGAASLQRNRIDTLRVSVLRP